MEDREEEAKLNIREEMEQKSSQELHKKCRDFCSVLRFLYWKAVQENKEEEAKHYSDARKTIEMLQERRHLQLLGEKGGYREAHQTMLEIIESRYVVDSNYTSEKSLVSIQDTINEIEQLCKDYEILGKEEIGEDERER